MADMEDDKDVSRRYRELGREEPPSSLDARIRAEARSALETHAAPLVAPTGRRRWYFPVAAAAVIVLAVAVTTQVEREQPAEPVAAAPEVKKEGALEEKQKDEGAKPQQPAQTDALAKRREPQPFAEQQKNKVTPQASTGERPSREDFSRDNRARQERPSGPPVAQSAAPPAVAPAPSSEAELRRSQRYSEPGTRGAETRKLDQAAQEKAPAPAASPAPGLGADMYGAAPNAGSIAGYSTLPQTPEVWLQMIAELRRQGRHDEADKQLEAFRKKFPDYKIPPETLKKVERP